MKSNLLRIATLLAVVGVLAASAQSLGQVITTNVPFAFRAGDQSLPAGKYTLVSNLVNGTVLIRADEGKDQMFILTNACGGSKASENAKLVFHRYGDQYFLSQVWHPGYSQGRELPRSSAEREMARAGQMEIATLEVRLR